MLESMKFSIITVCLNSESTVERTIKSVLDQKNVEVEYIIIDGGSTDCTMSIINKYKDRISIVVSESDNGIFDAMNKGISYATGDVIAFLNSDDWYEAGALSIVQNAFRKFGGDCVCGNNKVILKDGSVEIYDASRFTLADMNIRMIYFHEAIFAKRSFFDMKKNFDTRYKIAADYNWMLSAIKKGMKVIHINDILFTFEYGGISSIKEINCGKEARLIALENAVDLQTVKKIERRFLYVVLISQEREEISKIISPLFADKPYIAIWGAGKRGRQCIKWLKNSGFRVDAIVDKDCTKWNQVLEGIMIVPPESICYEEYSIIVTPDDYCDQIKDNLAKTQPECDVYTIQEVVSLFK